MRRLPLKLRETPFTLRDAIKQGATRYLIGKLISEGIVEQLARGVYQVAKGDIGEEDQFRSATLRVGKPSAVSLISALVHYGVSDLIPRKTWMMVPLSKRSNFTDIKLLRTRNPAWRVGIEKKEGYSITTLERTIVDCFSYPKKVGIQVAIEGLRRAVSGKKTTLGKVMDMAKQLEVEHRILPYIEALS